MLVAAAFLAIVPDLDFFLVWVLRMGPGWHRGFAHSIAFSVAVAALAAIALGLQWRRAFPVLFAAMASHCLMDALTSKLAPGVEFFWPLSSRRYSAGFVDYLDFSIRVRSPLEFMILVLKISVVEAIIFIPLFLLVRLIVHKVKTHKTEEAPIERGRIC